MTCPREFEDVFSGTPVGSLEADKIERFTLKCIDAGKGNWRVSSHDGASRHQWTSHWPS